MVPLAGQWEMLSSCRPLAQSSRELRNLCSTKACEKGWGLAGPVGTRCLCPSDLFWPIPQVALLWCVLRSLIVR